MPQPKQTRTTKAQAGEKPPEDANAIGEDVVAKLQAELAGKGVYATIAWVQQHVGAVEKTGRVSFGKTNFSHMQEHGLINVLRPLWRIAGLCVIGGVPHANGYRAEGGMFVVDFELRVIDTEDGDQVVSAYYPNVGVDTADKGFNKAYTGAMKYALQKFFLVPTSDIDDNETLDVTAVAAARAAAPPKQGTVADHPSEEDVTQLRTALLDAGVKPEQVVNRLTAEFAKSDLSSLTIAEFSTFMPIATEMIAKVRNA
jgi:hypothetical protein